MKPILDPKRSQNISAYIVVNPQIQFGGAGVISSDVGFPEVGAFSPDIQARPSWASAPEASGLKSPSQTFQYVGAEAPTSETVIFREHPIPTCPCAPECCR